MKRKVIVFVATVFVTVLSLFPVAAASSYTVSDVTLSLGSNYIVLTSANISKKSDKLTELGFSDKFKTSFSSEPDLVMIAMTEDLSSQLFLRKSTTAFSKEIKTFYGLSEETLGTIAGEISGSGYSGTYTTNGTTYLRFSGNGDALSDSVIYMTVENSSFYTFTYYGNDMLESANIMNTVKIPASSRPAHILTVKTIIMIVIIGVLIIALIVVLVMIIYSIIRDYKAAHNENDVSNYIKIKRRRF